MSDFDDVFESRRIRGQARFPLVGITVRSDRDVVLIGKHAGRSNKGYWSALFKIVQQEQGGKPTLAKTEANEALWRKLFAKHVITGWENVLDRDGKPLAYSPERLEALFAKLAEPDAYPEWVTINGPIDSFFTNGDNFRDDAIASAEQLGKE